jgi:hypothetical protein
VVAVRAAYQEYFVGDDGFAGERRYSVLVRTTRVSDGCEAEKLALRKGIMALSERLSISFAALSKSLGIGGGSF